MARCEFRLTIQQKTFGIQHQPVPTGAQRSRDIPSRLQPPELQESLIRPDCLSDQLGTPSFSLGSDDNTLLFLDSLIDEESRTLSNLLSDLLGLDGVCEFWRECDVGDRDVV